MELDPAERKTNHKRWLLGAIVLFIPIPVLLALQPGEPGPSAPQAAPALAPVAPPILLPSSDAGPLTCGQCNGDGRIDQVDRLRRVPTSSAPKGDCPYCGPGRAIGKPTSPPH